jgi:hypothetical protein
LPDFTVHHKIIWLLEVYERNKTAIPCGFGSFFVHLQQQDVLCVFARNN